MEVRINSHLFTWSESTGLAQRLFKPVKRMSIRTAAHGRPISVTLWHSDGTGLLIQSTMRDVAERREVGVLDFAIAGVAEDDEKNLDIPASFISGVKASKLVINESGKTAESGIVLEASDGQEIVVVAGAYPYSLAVSSLSSMPHGFEPEYPLETYTRVEIA